MASEAPFYLQIVDTAGVVIRTRAGGKHEADLIETFVKHIVPHGIGFLKTEAAVTQAIRNGIAEAIWDLKIQDPFDVI